MKTEFISIRFSFDDLNELEQWEGFKMASDGIKADSLPCRSIIDKKDVTTAVISAANDAAKIVIKEYIEATEAKLQTAMIKATSPHNKE